MKTSKCRLAAAIMVCALVLASSGCIESDDEPGPPRSMRVLTFDPDDGTSKVTFGFILLDADGERTRQEGTLKVTVMDSDDWYMMQEVEFDVSPPDGIRPNSADVYTLVVDYPAAGVDPDPTVALRMSHDRGYGDGERLMTAALTFEWGTRSVSDDADAITIPDGLLYPNEAPHAVLTAPATANVGADVTFDGSGSWDLESLSEDLRFTWEWAAGAGAQDGQPTEMHAFPRGGGPMPWMYVVTMTVIDDEDAEGVWVFNITVMDTLNVTVRDWGYNLSAEHSEETWVQLEIYNYGTAGVEVQPMGSKLVSGAGTIELEVSHEVVGSPGAQLPRSLAPDTSMDVICYFDSDLTFGAERIRYWNGLELDLP